MVLQDQGVKVDQLVLLGNKVHRDLVGQLVRVDSLDHVASVASLVHQVQLDLLGHWDLLDRRGHEVNRAQEVVLDQVDLLDLVDREDQLDLLDPLDLQAVMAKPDELDHKDKLVCCILQSSMHISYPVKRNFENNYICVTY
jgi:hypothetical protein